MSRDLFRCIRVVNFCLSKMLTEAITQSASRFTAVYLFTCGAGYVANKTRGNARKGVCDVNRSFRARELASEMYGQVLPLVRVHLKVPRWL